MPVSKHDLSMYPKATHDTKRHIIKLPERDKETEYKVEIYVGKIMKADSINRYTLMGKFIEKKVDGWGYSYLCFETTGGAMSTLVGGGRRIVKIVKSGSKLVSYNSRLPIVVYTPIEHSVCYKIWNRSIEEYTADRK